jgi:chromosome segregation ATPase
MKNAFVKRTLAGVCYLLIALLPSSCTFLDHRPPCCPTEKQAVTDANDRVEKAKKAVAAQKALIEEARQEVERAKKRLEEAIAAVRRCREPNPKSECLRQIQERESAKAALDTAKKKVEALRARRKELQEEVKKAEEALKKANEALEKCKQRNKCE